MYGVQRFFYRQELIFNFLSSATYFSKKFRISMNGLASARFFCMFVFAMAGEVAVSQALYGDDLDDRRDAPSVQTGQTLEFLLASEGDPTEMKSLAGKDYYLNSYYYRDTNTSYIVNTETGYICDDAMGKHTGYCPSDTEQNGINK